MTNGQRRNIPRGCWVIKDGIYILDDTAEYKMRILIIQPYLPTEDGRADYIFLHMEVMAIKETDKGIRCKVSRAVQGNRRGCHPLIDIVVELELVVVQLLLEDREMMILVVDVLMKQNSVTDSYTSLYRSRFIPYKY